VSKWMGNILISLSQFDKIRNEVKVKNEENEKDLSSKHFYNVWSILNKLSDNLHNKAPFKKSSDVNLGRIKKGMLIYEQFQANNYVGADNSTFELINMLKHGAIEKENMPDYYYDFGRNKVRLEIRDSAKTFCVTNIITKKQLSVLLNNNDLTVTNNSSDTITLKDY